MRTTVTIDADVHVMLIRAMAERSASFKQVLNDALRQGLSGATDRRRAVFRQSTWDMGMPLVDLTKATALAGELEDLDLAARLARGR